MFLRVMIIVAILAANASNTFCQQATNDSAKKNSVFTFVEQMPQFPGGQESLMEFLESNLQYPDSARHYDVEGRVVANFIVNEDGSICDAKIVHGLGHGCDEEVLRVISIMPKWIPGKQNGTLVKVYFNLPVTFKLAEPDPSKPNITSPSYPGGDDSLHAFVQKNLIYPKAAKKNKTEGQVVLSFVIDSVGKTRDAKVYKSIGAGCDEEAIRILNLIPHWNPGTKNGKAATMPYYLEVQFTLPKSGK
ncbi:MAG: energy transducer TonB [Chitinophagales bacterium]